MSIFRILSAGLILSGCLSFEGHFVEKCAKFCIANGGVECLERTGDSVVCKCENGALHDEFVADWVLEPRGRVKGY